MALRRAAIAMEATFFSAMLKSAGFGEPRDSFGGGIGEAQFASFLCDETARSVALQGGLGLADSILAALQAGSRHEG